nr:MAG TPA: hypothetical protein [Caudoviricetes sp.]
MNRFSLSITRSGRGKLLNCAWSTERSRSLQLQENA